MTISIRTHLTIVAALAVMTALAGCSSKDTAVTPDPTVKPAASWEVIQTEILDKNCIVCHTAGTSFANQSGLVLTSDVSYEQLVNHEPHNVSARTDGIVRVGSDGFVSLFSSFLWEKINAPNQAHFFNDHPQYGALMPLGLPALTNGEIEFVRQWIVGGAPRTGVVASRDVLEDTERYTPPVFKPLDPPAQGIQLTLGPFDINPNYEREVFYYVPLNNSEELYVTRAEISMRPGSHHFIIYGFQNDIPPSVVPRPHVIRDVRDANGNYIVENLVATRYHKYVTGTQWPLMNYVFPPGVALRIPADSGLDLNSHYVNRGSEVFPGEVITNLHTIPLAEVEHVAETLFLSHDTFELPPQQITQLTRTFTFSERRHIFQLFSHAHQHMTEFKVHIAGGARDGELVYVAFDWQHPPILELNPPLTLEPGQGLRLAVTYNNWTDRTLRFGLLSEDEMMILFGAYYSD